MQNGKIICNTSVILTFLISFFVLVSCESEVAKNLEAGKRYSMAGNTEKASKCFELAVNTFKKKVETHNEHFPFREIVELVTILEDIESSQLDKKSKDDLTNGLIAETLITSGSEDLKCKEGKRNKRLKKLDYSPLFKRLQESTLPDNVKTNYIFDLFIVLSIYDNHHQYLTARYVDWEKLDRTQGSFEGLWAWLIKNDPDSSRFCQSAIRILDNGNKSYNRRLFWKFFRPLMNKIVKADTSSKEKFIFFNKLIKNYPREGLLFDEISKLIIQSDLTYQDKFSLFNLIIDWSKNISIFHFYSPLVAGAGYFSNDDLFTLYSEARNKVVLPDKLDDIFRDDEEVRNTALYILIRNYFATDDYKSKKVREAGFSIHEFEYNYAPKVNKGTPLLEGNIYVYSDYGNEPWLPGEIENDLPADEKIRSVVFILRSKPVSVGNYGSLMKPAFVEWAEVIIVNKQYPKIYWQKLVRGPRPPEIILFTHEKKGGMISGGKPYREVKKYLLDIYNKTKKEHKK
ncbi:MAG: hypothetical protein U9N54_03895 [candidate division Zixibacteria bacterium]|nr:hypothetical protein [candidate division Zixibacteria bacterium]